MKSYRFVIIISLITVIFLSIALSQDSSNVIINRIQVTDNISLLQREGAGNTSVLVGEEGVLIIDTQFEDSYEQLIGLIGEVSEKPIKYVLNTNWHFDHVGSNALLAKNGASIIAHYLSKERMMHEQTFPLLGMTIPQFSISAIPNVLIKNDTIIHFNNEDIQIYHLKNAHSDADLIFYYKKANVLHVGDIVTHGGYPYIDVTNGGSINGLITAVENISKMIDENTKLITGHGNIADSKYLADYKNMLVTIRDRFSKLIEEGHTVEEVIVLNPKSDFDESFYDWLPDNGFIKMIYNDLSDRSLF